MPVNIVEVECLECEKEFETTRMKSTGETFKCTHCNYEHFADYDEVEETWFTTHVPTLSPKLKM